MNPFGLEYWKYIIQAAIMPRPNVMEWHATNLFGPLLQWFMFKIVVLTTIIATCFSLFRNKLKNLDITKLLILAIMLFLSLKHIKHQPLFVIVAGSFIYSDLHLAIESLKQKLYRHCERPTGARQSKEINKCPFGLLRRFTPRNDLICFLIIIVGSIIIVFTPLQLTIPQSKYPVASVEFIKQNKLKGNLLSLFNWGSYLSYKLFPNCLVAVDGRYEEVYPEETINLTSDFIYVLDKNWYNILKEYKVDILLLDKQFDSYKMMQHSPVWKEVFQDPISAVFVRKTYPMKKFTPVFIDYDLINKNKFETSKNFLYTIGAMPP
jgi:hypothetical protein